MKPQNSPLSQRSSQLRSGATRIKADRIWLAIVMLLAGLSCGCSSSQSTMVNPSASQVDSVGQTEPPLLISVSISPESRVKAVAEDVTMELRQGIWQEFSIEIDNAAGITAPLFVESEQILQFDGDSSRDRWLQLELIPDGALTGKSKENRILRIKSRDQGIRSAILNFNAGQGTQDLGFRSDVLLSFKIHGT